MTTRVFDSPRPIPVSQITQRPIPRPKRKVGLRGALLTALFVAPIAGAGEAPTGWLVTAATGLIMLHLAAILGARLPWGWLTVVLSILGLVVPRERWPLIGPALFVATAVSLAVWFAARDNGRRRKADRPEVGTRERAAQVVLGFSGERRVAHVLAEQLPEDYVLVNGLTLPRGAGDIDHVVVGPTGLFLLETKTMRGRIVCEDDGKWRRTRVGRGGTTYSAYVGDPSAQVQRNIFAVRQVLRRRLPVLSSRTLLWIEGLVVFAHPDTQLDARGSRVPAVLLSDATRRICTHAPRRSLQPNEVNLVTRALLEEGGRGAAAGMLRESAQALVEFALALPLVLVLLFGTMAVSRVVQARTAVIGLAHEVARAAALAHDPTDASARMRDRAAVVAPGLGLDPRMLVLNWDLSRFASDPGEVIARVDYPVDLGDLPMLGALPSVVVHAEHVERVDPFRSGLTTSSEARR